MAVHEGTQEAAFSNLVCQHKIRLMSCAIQLPSGSVSRGIWAAAGFRVDAFTLALATFRFLHDDDWIHNRVNHEAVSGQPDTGGRDQTAQAPCICVAAVVAAKRQRHQQGAESGHTKSTSAPNPARPFTACYQTRHEVRAPCLLIRILAHLRDSGVQV
jgi:hypothetical protein